MPDQSKRPLWREKTPKDGASADTKRPWRPKEPAHTETRKSSKKVRIVGLGLLILVVLGLLVYLVLVLNKPKLADLVIAGAGYFGTSEENPEDNPGVLANPYGLICMDELEKYAENEREVTSWQKQKLFHPDKTAYTYNSKSRDKFLNALKKAEHETVIVYVPLHGGTDKQGPYLIPNNYNIYPLEEKTPGKDLLRVEEILEALADPKLKDKKKVLILDATQLQAHAPLGMLHNDFARKLKSLLDEKFAKEKNLVVLCASSEGQRSWTSEEWGRTVFGHYVLEGLKGAANPDGNRRIDMQELYDYVEKNVGNWARANRNEEQIPLLWKGEGTDLKKIELVAIKEGYTKDEQKKNRPRPEGAALADEAVRKKLKKAWDDCYNLYKQIPSPTTHSPQLWRRYLDTLLRYEYLLRSGYPGKNGTDRLLANLQEWKKQMEDAQRLPDSLEKVLPGSLPMYAVLGRSAPWSDGKLKKWLNELWAPDAKLKKTRQEIWKELNKEALGKNPEDEALLRVKLASLVLQRPEPLEVEDREKRKELLEFFHPDGQQRPAEVHFLMMLHQDLMRSEQLEAKWPSKALAVRLQAEQVALTVKDLQGSSDSARIYPWIEDEIIKGDRERYLGQDWLFGANVTAWKTADDYLAVAKSKYDSAHKLGRMLHDALAVRDDALAQLPYYSQWLAHWPFTPDQTKLVDERKRLDQWVEEIEGLWEHTHLLAFRLQKPDVTGIQQAPKPNDKIDPNPKSLNERAQLVREGLDKLRQKFATECKNLAATSARLQSLWHEIDAALAVPFIEPGLRLKLLEASQKISTSLQDAYEQEPERGLQADEPPGKEAERKQAAEERWKAAARLRGRMAIATLGRPWIEQQDAEFASLKKTLQRDQLEWWKLHEVGEQVGKLWRRLPQQLALLAKDADKANALAKMEAELASAEIAGRQLDGAAAAVVKFDPVLENRLLHLHRLLLSQANRSWHEHWWCTEEEQKNGKPPYYVTAATTYLNAARDLKDVSNKANLNLGKLRQAEAEAASRPRTVVTAQPTNPRSLDWTSERYLEVSWEIRDQGVPEGVAMVWRKTKKNRELLEPAEKETRHDFRKACPIGALDKLVKYKLRSPALEKAAQQEAQDDLPPEPRIESPKVVLQGLYRGQRIDSPTDIKLHLGADTIVYQHTPPAYARIAVQTDQDVHLGSIAIVLDCSGSMSEKCSNGKSRLKNAREALRTVLLTLPKGTNLSLWAFGHKNPTRDGFKVEQIQEPILLGKSRAIQVEIEEVMAKANNLKLDRGNTPLLEAMKMAKEDLKNEIGFKTLLILTDGDDSGDKNGKYKNTDYDYYHREIKKTFAGKNIVINMIIFESSDVEIESARKQFREPILNLSPAGNWLEAKGHEVLALRLKQSMRPQLKLLRGDGSPVEKMHDDDFGVQLHNETPKWSDPLATVKNGILYEIKVHNVRQFLDLDPGDCMDILIKQKPGSREIFFERRLCAHLAKFEDLPHAFCDKWRLSVLQNKQVRDREQQKCLEMLVTLEDWKNVAAQKGHLKQYRPTFIWFDLLAKGEHQPGLRVVNEWNRQGPTWKLHVTAWPKAELGLLRPELDTWWTESPTQDLDRLGQATYKELKGQTRVEKGNGAVVIESIQFEERFVRGWKDKKAKCLVVRLQHKLGKPIWVQLDGPVYQGEEHHFYPKANKVTAVFYQVDKAQVEAPGFTLNLISLDTFKGNTQLKVRSDKLKLTAPNTDDGPIPVPEP